MRQSRFWLSGHNYPCWSCYTLCNCIRRKSCIVQVEDSTSNASMFANVAKLSKHIESTESEASRYKEANTKQMQSSEATHKHVSKLEYDNSKAGLQKVNKAEVQRVIEEASRGSAFYESERRRELLRKERNQIILQKAKEFEMLVQSLQQVRKKGNSSITKEQKQKQEEKLEELKEIKERVRKCISELEQERDLTKRYVHIDMDMFYAAVEERRDPTLRNRPFAVGSFSMLCTSNYIARQYGVRSGMPGFIAKKLCPQLWIIPPDFTAYTEIAEVVRSIAKQYDPQYISVGLDELTMDVSDYLKKHPELTVSAVCESFRQKVFARTHLTCSGGIAPTAALAKIASNVNKPNGQHEVVLRSRAEVIKYISTIPIRQIPGIGFAQESLLNALGVTQCKHFLQKKELMCYLFREKTFAFYLSIGLGLVRTRVDRALNERKRVQRKSIHKEWTISHRIRSSQEACNIVQTLFDQAYETLLSEHAQCRCVVLVVKTRTFDLHTTQRTLPSRSNERVVLWRAILELLEPVLVNYSSYRLLGVSFHDLSFAKQKKNAKVHVHMSKERLQEEPQEESSSSAKASSAKACKASNKSKKTNTTRRKTTQNKSTNKKSKSKTENAKRSSIIVI